MALKDKIREAYKKQVVEVFEKNNLDAWKTAKELGYKNRETVYAWLRKAGYKLPERKRDEKGRYIS